MKAKNLIKIIQLMDPEEEVCFGIGNSTDFEYREMCAKAEIVSGECLDYLRVTDAIIDRDTSYGKEKLLIYLNLEQFNINDIKAEADEFDKKYKLIEE